MKMTSFNLKNVKSASVLSALGLFGLSVLSAGSVFADDDDDEAPEVIHLTGIVRDFKERTVPGGHPDFERRPAHGFGHYVGNVERQLGENDKPAFLENGIGRKVKSEARDAEGHKIAPHLANRTITQGVSDFDIDDGGVVPGQDYTVQVSVLGAAISYGGQYDMPVTVRVRIDDKKLEPFGKFKKAVKGNVNDGSAPRHFVAPDVYEADTRVSVAGRAWIKKNSSKRGKRKKAWKTHMTVDSDSASPNVLALRDGDSAPNIRGFLDQGSIVDFIGDYIDPETNRVVLDDNQAIYLFELGMTNLSHPAADFQDLVVLVSLANIPEFFTDGQGSEVEVDLGDTPAVEGKPDHGGLTSSTHFDQWYRDVPGINISKALTLALVLQDDGTYVFDDQEDPFYSERDGFFPIDDELFGNSDGSPYHNFHFTFELHAEFTYDASAGQMFQFVGNDDVWVFINGQLVIDLGDVHPTLDQYIDLDRLGLQDGEVYRLDFFFAERYSTESNFRITTNLPLQTIDLPTISAQYD